MHSADSSFEEELRHALGGGNMSSLLMALFQLTGDERWLSEPYRPTRNRGLGDHRTGGLTIKLREEISNAAFDALVAHRNGTPLAVPQPDPNLLHRMMECCVGEPVPVDYVDMVSAQMDVVTVTDEKNLPEDSKRFFTIIIGAGISGLLAALKLKQAGRPFIILERQDDLGGNWQSNRYPGCGVDTPSYLYSFSFFRRNWSTHFAKRNEVMQYLHDVATHFDLYEHIQFGVDVLEANYQSEKQEWNLRCSTAEGTEKTYHTNALISAVGLFHTATLPPLSGIDSFSGSIFHSAHWPNDLDLKGKRVVVVGTGASSMQIVPAIVNDVKELTIFQRSPQWIAPNEEYFQPMDEGHHWLAKNMPFYLEWYRFRLSWTWTDKIYPALQKDPSWPHPERSMNAVNDNHREYFTAYLMEQLKDRPDLLKKTLPNYPPFGKRILLDNGWYAAIQNPHVNLVTEAVALVTPRGVKMNDGAEVEADVIVFCTGFKAQNFAETVDFRGASGAALSEVWQGDDCRAFLGIATPDFPNLFFLYGPNTNPIGGSYINIAECQIRYIIDLLSRMTQGKVGSIEVKEKVHSDYNKQVDAIHANMVWTHPGMRTYYRNSQGRVVTNIPWRIVEYWEKTKEANLDDYICLGSNN